MDQQGLNSRYISAYLAEARLTLADKRMGEGVCGYAGLKASHRKGRRSSLDEQSVTTILRELPRKNSTHQSKSSGYSLRLGIT